MLSARHALAAAVRCAIICVFTCRVLCLLRCSFWDELARRLDDSIDDSVGDGKGGAGARPRFGSLGHKSNASEVIIIALLWLRTCPALRGTVGQRERSSPCTNTWMRQRHVKIWLVDCWGVTPVGRHQHDKDDLMSSLVLEVENLEKKRSSWKKSPKDLVVGGRDEVLSSVWWQMCCAARVPWLHFVQGKRLASAYI